MISPIFFLFLLAPILTQDCIEPTCIRSLNQAIFTKDDLIDDGWQFKNFANDSNSTVEYLRLSYLGGSDHGRIIFSKLFNVTPSHYSLTVNFTIINYEGLNPNDRFLVYADGLRAYIFDPTLFAGVGPFPVSFSFLHQNPNVTIEFRSEDSNTSIIVEEKQEEEPEEQPESGRLLVSFGRMLAESDNYNIALKKTTNQSSTENDYNSSFAVDGNLDRSNTSLSIAKTLLTFAPEIPFFYVDLEHPTDIKDVRITLSENVTFANASSQYVLTIGNDSNITNNSICRDGLDLGSGTFHCSLNGRYVGLYYKMLNVSSGQLEIAEIEIFQNIQNILGGSTVNQSSIFSDNATLFGPANAIDNSTWFDPEQGLAAITQYELNPWWMANVTEPQQIRFIRISLTSNKTMDYFLKLNVTIGNSSNLTEHLPCVISQLIAGDFLCDILGSYIIVQVNGEDNDTLELAEVEAYVAAKVLPPANYAIRDLIIQVNVCDSRCESCAGPKLCTPKDIFRSEEAIVSLMDNNTFAAEVLSSRWTFGNISKDNFEYVCGGIVYLGGYKVFEGGSYFEEKLDIPAFHYKLRVGLDLLVLDDFYRRNNEFVVFADDIEVFRYSPLVGLNENNQTLAGYSYLCGREDRLDTVEQLKFEFLHSSQSLKLKFLSNSTLPTVNASYGLRNLVVDYYQCYWQNGCFQLSRRLDETYLRAGRYY